MKDNTQYQFIYFIYLITWPYILFTHCPQRTYHSPCGIKKFSLLGLLAEWCEPPQHDTMIFRTHLFHVKALWRCKDEGRRGREMRGSVKRDGENRCHWNIIYCDVIGPGILLVGCKNIVWSDCLTICVKGGH